MTREEIVLLNEELENLAKVVDQLTATVKMINQRYLVILSKLKSPK